MTVQLYHPQPKKKLRLCEILKLYCSFFIKISLEGRILLSVCLADCFLSLYLLQAKLAIEVNPLMRFLFEEGAGYFVMFKIFWSVLFIYFLEVLGKQEPEFIRKGYALGHCSLFSDNCFAKFAGLG